MDGLLMVRLFAYVLWIIQIACLVIILYCSWQLLDREVFALVAASLTLLTTLYIEHGLPIEDDG
jgi:hypothetical protein